MKESQLPFVCLAKSYPGIMLDRVHSIVAAVIAKADRNHPADSVLRAELRRQHGLSPMMSRAVATAVFAYYRWLGWQDSSESLQLKVQSAVDLSRRFAEDPRSFENADLLERAIPKWVHDHVNVSAAWVRKLQKEPSVWLRARLGKGSELAKALGDCHILGPDRLGDALRYDGATDLFSTKEFHSGEFELQDVTSQAVGWICHPQPGETWWDACAGEGGKTVHLADLMANKGLIWASDRADWRLKVLKRRAARAKIFNYRAALWNGGAKLPTKTLFDGVLVDAPCSGLGTWQRNPHARWTTTPDDIRELSALQSQLLAHASKAVKPGGRIVYAVCTLSHAETVQVAAEFGEQFSDFKPSALPNPFESEKNPQAQHWWWPQDQNGNGMFVAVWRRET